MAVHLDQKRPFFHHRRVRHRASVGRDDHVRFAIDAKLGCEGLSLSHLEVDETGRKGPLYRIRHIARIGYVPVACGSIDDRDAQATGRQWWKICASTAAIPKQPRRLPVDLTRLGRGERLLPGVRVLLCHRMSMDLAHFQ